MSKQRRRFTIGFLAIALLQGGAGCHSFDRSGITGEPDIATVCEPNVASDQSMMAVAKDLDQLELLIDWFGSVTAKAPDIWGEARLTRYRNEIDQELAKELHQFNVALSGQIARADQSFFESATTLSALASVKEVAKESGKSGAEFVIPPLIRTSRETIATTFNKEGEEVKKVTVMEGPASLAESPAPAPEAVAPPAESPKDMPPPSNPTIVSTAPSPVTQRKILKTVEGIGLEPTEKLNQLKRYLDYLGQLRRNNEGDDTADSPGYALTLMRIPVSLLPGKRTDVGHGAEITFTVSPVLSDELLPATFRTLLINDLVDQLGFPLSRYLDDPEANELLSEKNRLIVRHLEEITAITKASPEQKVTLISELRKNSPKLADALGISEDTIIQNFLLYGINLTNDDKMSLRDYLTNSESRYIPTTLLDKMRTYGANKIGTAGFDAEPINDAINQITRVREKLEAVKVPFSTGTRGRQSIPFSQYLEVFGGEFAFEIAYQAQHALGSKFKQQGYAHLPDVQSFLKIELEAAYRLLRHERNQHLWTKYCTPDLVHLVHTRNYHGLQLKREEFRAELLELAGGVMSADDLNKQPQYSSTVALAWKMVVDAALLADRLTLDIKEVLAAKGQATPLCGEYLPYFHPNPPIEARRLFNQYVQLRWPIHVFALDPATDDQNIADSLSVRRESQFALSLAFAAGRINVNQFTRFARRLESEYEALQLNRTQLGFSNGENIFGWRFYPRFQTPETRSNLNVILRDHLIGGPNRNQLLRERRLEAGPRECVALVIMPSFVPYVTLDSTSNWFGLANPKHKVFDHTQALRLSRKVQAIRTGGCQVSDADQYRAGDLARLLNRAEQLSSRLPMQSVTQQVPIDSNLGGFELFVSGTTDLAPELYGWYGAPGIRLDRDTELFLVGKHFSVTQSRILVGNQPIKSLDMISRQVMKITVPAGSFPTGKSVQVNVSTPYGVSQDLLVPVYSPDEKPSTQPAIGLPTSIEIAYEKIGKTKGEFELAKPEIPSADTLWIQWPTKAGNAPANAKADITFLYRDCPITIRVENLKSQGGLYELNQEAIIRICNTLFRSLNPFGPFSDANNPLNDGFTSSEIKIIPVIKGTALSDLTEKSEHSIRLTFQCSIPTPAK
ncbi:hypothetical protein [Tuwongella immobilis]|uniref:IPT/TIG domain-containing protein n=1 Tax=Tuwongella immobilis TaxID=692036 RepID=A0A6C2YIM9_9BACT|nr:hypothetical protein [Tuwongella immobilis]VIP01398.1 Uncharacterized protein OS=Singulisphaera acidiphila (strain ATCC BAA-1392 / DSM 18658 / VKM B-2454 / MOB10) GN=Sinac_2187 PE=4 SV=1 [Tuwongella immobilis]VTR98287.1 Uncharacterized protein OS=Singulisphaera acidiphila (strain ATCC BAA-1392 / DSM 18658 / VKM B-2454 / MOB10) GN=Sinac_2187 PE=4 SV=1 [Tuwongella immobilis]